MVLGIVVPAGGVCVVVCWCLPLFVCVFGVCETELFHLASNGCNRWEMEIVGVLHITCFSWSH